MKRKVGGLLTALGALLCMAALGLTVYNFWDNYRAGVEAERVAKTIIQYRKEILQNADPDEGSSVDPSRELPVLEIDGNRYVGTISIPSLEIELPVLENWSLDLLKVAPCRYLGSPYSSDLIICAHNYNTHFGNLKNVTPGDEVIFTDVEGNAFPYIVAELDTLPGTSVQEMESGEWDLTLFTCTLNGRSRVTVRCDSAANNDET